MASTDSLPIPRKNVAYRAVFPILDADGDLVTGAAGLDSEVSKDQGTFADCTNEATEIATSSGMYYLDLTSTEMNADCVAVIVKTSTSGAKTTPLVFYPLEDGDWRVNLVQILGTAAATPATAGILDVNVKNMNNVAATSITAVNANQGTTQPINFTGTAGSALAKSDMVDVAGSAVSTSTAQLGVNVVNNAGSAITSAAGVQEVKVASIAANAITATSIATDAITAGKIAADAIGASELAADAATEIATAVAGLSCTEPTGVVGASPTLIAAVSWLNTLSRNKITQTATAQVLKADDGSTTIATSTVSDDGTTATRGEFA